MLAGMWLVLLGLLVVGMILWVVLAARQTTRDVAHFSDQVRRLAARGQRQKNAVPIEITLNHPPSTPADVGVDGGTVK